MEERSDTPLAPHLRQLVDRRFDTLRDCRRFWAADEPETALHDLRVASRRLRAFADAFAESMGEKLHVRVEKPLERITRAAGAVRDLDVRTTLVESRLVRCATDAERAAAEHLLDRTEHDRALATKQARKKLRKVDFDELSGLLHAALDRTETRLPAPEAALRRHVRERFERLVTEAASHAGVSSDAGGVESMHRLRIATKKLRYTMELFEPLFGEAYVALHDRATALQDTLGAHHDLVVLGQRLERDAAELEARKLSFLARGTAELRRAIAVDTETALARYASDPFDPNYWYEQGRL